VLLYKPKLAQALIVGDESKNKRAYEKQMLAFLSSLSRTIALSSASRIASAILRNSQIKI
jgi:hypothetical protein